MRLYLALAGLCLACTGCWDFESLGRGLHPDLRTSAGDGGRDQGSGDLACTPNGKPEDCTNGVDDNGDCKVDCADPSCANTGFCTTLGFLTFGKLATGDCPKGSQSTLAPLYDQIDGTKNVCTQCQCSGPTTCTTSLALYMGDKCPGTALQTTPLPGAMECVPATAPAGADHYLIATPTTDCAPKSPTAQADQDAWKTKGQLCMLDTAPSRCTTLSCVLAAYAGDRSGVCIAFTGENMKCPDPFSAGSTWYQKYTDSGRTCTCACGQPNDGSLCTGDIYLANNTMCKNAGTNHAAKVTNTINQCSKFPGGVDPGSLQAVDYTIKPVDGAKCSAGGTVMGAAPMLSQGVTLCCVP